MKSNRIGEDRKNNFGSRIIIKDYRNSIDIDVYFPEYDWMYYNATYSNFKHGALQCPYEKRFYNKGYIGEGKYTTKHESFKHWYRMLSRCYDNKCQEKEPSYIGSQCYDEWHNFQNFAKWFDDNYYKINNERMQLDKDILYKGNKLYSPETCVFVSQRINNLFTKRQNDRGDLPIGVTRIRDKYLAQINKNGRRERKIWDDIDSAFNWYKIEKEKYIKQIADKYKHIIPEKLYKAMYEYKVDMND